ncbi:hypothetical protein BGX21_003145 [Mortierella sp. AD011]|nr:hypothetical protein BGX20_008424 [Mortierella sp. AD010]KAF9400936.1 hypothetical protein BGX21_003145 [Mortierella sp. AD011]
MKFITAITLSTAALVATASADMLQINNPTNGTEWTTNVPGFVGWNGNCASMGKSAKIVKVDLVDGPSTAVRYVATLGTLDCSGTNTRADMTVPDTVPSGQYAIVVRTSPAQSYTSSFRINNPSLPDDTSSATAPAATPGQTQSAGSTPTGSSAKASQASTQSSIGSGAMFAIAGVVALGLQVL